MLDALAQALGDRADPGFIRNGEDRADIHATFDISNVVEARLWLDEHDLLDGEECLLRRIITREGRSRGYINGRPATLQEMKLLGEKLIDIHNQHAHQSLLKKDQQRRLLDEFAGLKNLNSDIKTIAQQYQHIQQRLDHLINNRNEQTARAQLLGYQVEELNALDLQTGEIAALEQEQKLLANGEQILQATQHTIALCNDGELNVSSILNQAIRSLTGVTEDNPALQEAEQLLNSALIQVEEASAELQQHCDNFELNPERLQLVESRLSTIYDIARKHKLSSEQLPEFHQGLLQELSTIAGSNEEIDSLQQQLSSLNADYQQFATKLSKKRASAASKLQKQVAKQLQSLAMAHCQLSIQLNPRESQHPHSHGNEDIQFFSQYQPRPATTTVSQNCLRR